jgi:multidrug transporter EmrE-like cation transporter
MQALGYVIVTGLAFVVFQETVGVNQVIGLALIVTGVTVLAWGAGK